LRSFVFEYRVLPTPYHVLSGMSHDYANNFSVPNIRPAERCLLARLADCLIGGYWLVETGFELKRIQHEEPVR